MTDPTEMVLTGSFAVALGGFVICSLARLVRGWKSRWQRVVAVPSLMDADAPYQVPVVVPMPPELPAGRVPVWFYLPLDLVGIGMVYGVFVLLGIASVRSSHDAVVELKAGTLLVGMGFQLFMAGAIALVVVRRVGWEAWLGLRWPGWPWVFLIGPGAVVLMLVVFGGLQWFGFTEWMESLGVETVQDTVKLLQKSEDPLILGLMTLAAVVVAPLCEEIVFRGYLYPVLKKFAGVWAAAVCSGLVFASAHGNLTALLPLFVFGVVLVLVYEKTGSLWSAIAVHCCFNSATVIVQIAARYFHVPLDKMP